MLSLRGRTKEEQEAKTWGEWMTSLTGAYMLMDDGCTDVFSFYLPVVQLLKEVLDADSDNGFAKKWLAKIQPTDESSEETNQQEAHQSVDQSLDSSASSSLTGFTRLIAHSRYKSRKNWQKSFTSK